MRKPKFCLRPIQSDLTWKTLSELGMSQRCVTLPVPNELKHFGCIETQRFKSGRFQDLLQAPELLQVVEVLIDRYNMKHTSVAYQLSFHHPHIGSQT